MRDYRFLLTGRWLALVTFVLVLLPLFSVASRWQFNRLEEARDSNSLITSQSTQPAVPLESLGEVVTEATEWRGVTLVGTYDATGEVLVRRRFLNGTVGYWVATPLRTERGLVVVNRGWIPAGRDATTAPSYPSAPEGSVEISGRLRQAETRSGTKPADLPAGQTDALIPAEFGSSFQGYIELVGEQMSGSRTPSKAGSPDDQVRITPVPLPELTEGNHWSYAWQWRLFMGLAIVGLGVLARGNAQRIREERSHAHSASNS